MKTAYAWAIAELNGDEWQINTYTVRPKRDQAIHAVRSTVGASDAELLWSQLKRKYNLKPVRVCVNAY